MSYCIIHNLTSLNMLLSAEDASKELATELVLADITQEQLFGEFADLWKNYPEVSNFGVWLVHGLASGLQPGERMVSRTETDDDWTSALITQPTSIVNTAPVAPPVRAYRWMADGREIAYHADNMGFKRPSDTFFQDFQEILRKYNITTLGVGPDPMATPSQTARCI
ncbi:hypothetical protein CPB84DRAFT_187296 [Gymnopilus junonius]|uniref:Uncharacterized protein n=1 Tax=Gymnopilus junonius TaxID=109634 RepID=A0A9P5TJR6_GYMJU|nr:hypothetical protein CPB84DRAFT_187296 [Gymnopilus junonius]